MVSRKRRDNQRQAGTNRKQERSRETEDSQGPVVITAGREKQRQAGKGGKQDRRRKTEVERRTGGERQTVESRTGGERFFQIQYNWKIFVNTNTVKSYNTPACEFQRLEAYLL